LAGGGVTNTEALAELLEGHAHYYDSDCGYDFGCECGAIKSYDESDVSHSQHLAQVINEWLNRGS
jgi:hypothetical protein